MARPPALMGPPTGSRASRRSGRHLGRLGTRVKTCPACRAELLDNAVACPSCGGSYLPDGSFKTPWDAEMDRLAVERERKVRRAEAFGRWGKPHTSWFLEGKGGGCLVVALAVATGVVALEMVLA